MFFVFFFLVGKGGGGKKKEVNNKNLLFFFVVFLFSSKFVYYFIPYLEYFGLFPNGKRGELSDASVDSSVRPPFFLALILFSSFSSLFFSPPLRT